MVINGNLNAHFNNNEVAFSGARAAGGNREKHTESFSSLQPKYSNLVKISNMPKALRVIVAAA